MALITAEALITGSGSLTGNMVRLLVFDIQTSGSGTVGSRLVLIIPDAAQITGDSAVSTLQLLKIVVGESQITCDGVVTAIQVKIITDGSQITGNGPVSARQTRIKPFGCSAGGISAFSCAPLKNRILRCNISGKADVTAYQYRRDIHEALKSYIPPFLREAMKPIRRSGSIELTTINALIEDALNQMFVDTATWGLDIYEKEYGLDTNGSAYQERRDRIKNKIQSKRKTMTKAYLKELMDVWYITEIVEDFPGSRVTVKIMSVRGIPENYDVMQKYLNGIGVPAHLISSLECTYLPWSELDGTVTYDQLETYTCKQLEETFL